MDLIAQLARELNLKADNIEAAVKLIDEGNTIPFISRYRKEATGGMDDVALRALDERLSYLRNLEQRKKDVILLIDAQGKLTPELEQQIREATQLQRVEDLYKPYRKKRMTRAQKAREAGLEPLANMVIMQASAKGSALDAAAAYVNEEAGFDTPEKALAGAADIVAETVAEDPENVADLRAFTQNTADIVVEATDPAEKTPYEPYYSYDEPLRRIPNHRVLAIDRGEREGKLRVRVNVDGAAATARLGSRWPRRQGVFAPIFDAAIADGYKRLMAPSLEREARAKLTVRAQTEAINVFAKNLEGLPRPWRPRARARPGLPHRLQGRRHGRDRQTTRPRRGLPHQAAPRRRRHQARARSPRQEGQRQHHRHRQRHRQPRDRGSRLGVHCRAGARAAIHHRQRGRRVGVLRLRARQPGISRPGRHRARRHEPGPPPARPAGRARQDSAPVHRRWPVPARP